MKKFMQVPTSRIDVRESHPRTLARVNSAANRIQILKVIRAFPGKTLYCFFDIHHLSVEGQGGITYRLRRGIWHRWKQTLSGRER